MICRDTAKRQIAAARTLIVLIQTRALRPADAATDFDQLTTALGRLESTTEALAQEVYKQDTEVCDGVCQ